MRIRIKESKGIVKGKKSAYNVIPINSISMEELNKSNLLELLNGAGMTTEQINEAITNIFKNIKSNTDLRENIKGGWQTVSIGCDTNEIRCTACKQITVVPADRTRKLNFCPECGADMREVKK